MPSKVDFRPQDVFQYKPAELSTMVFLDPEPVENPTLLPISGSLAMQRLREQSLNYLSSVEKFGLLETYFLLASHISNLVPSYILFVPKAKNLFNVESFLSTNMFNLV